MKGKCRKTALRGLMCALLSHTVAGCAAQAAEDREITEDNPLLAQATLDAARGLWSSAPFSGGPWIPIGPTGMVTIHHGLGRVPLSVQVYLSFTEDDSIWIEEGEDEPGEPRRFFPAAGDVANVLKATDQLLVLRNNTRGAFYVRVLLQ